MESISDPQLKRHIRQLYYLCDHFFTNSNEKRFISYIQEEILKIKQHISVENTNNKPLNNLLDNLPQFDDRELDLIARSRKEKVISILYLFVSIPFVLGSARFQADILDTIKDKAVYNDKHREEARAKVLARVAKISNLTIPIIEKLK